METKLDSETIEKAVATLGAIATAVEKLRSHGDEIKKLMNTTIAELSTIKILENRRIVLTKFSRAPGDIDPVTLNVVCMDGVEGKIVLHSDRLDIYRGERLCGMGIWFYNIRVEDVLKLAAVEKCSPGTLKALEEALNNLVNIASNTIEQLKTIIAMAKMLLQR